MPSQDHPIFKHMREDARGRADRAAASALPGAAAPRGSAPVPDVDPARAAPPPKPTSPANPAPQPVATQPPVNAGQSTASAAAPVGPPAIAPPLASPRRAPGPGRPSRWRRVFASVLPPYGAQPTGRSSVGAPAPPRRDKLLRAMRDAVLRSQRKGRLVARTSEPTPGRLVDVLLAGAGEPKLPDEVFPRLRWGGVFAYACTNEKSVRNLAEAYDNKRGFLIEQMPAPIHAGLPFPGLRTAGYGFVARKVQLIQPGDTTERFTYHVELSRCPVTPDTPDGYLVTKRVPTYQNMVWRLRQKFPEVDVRDLENRARKLVDHVFPTFLTREAAMLGILQKNLAPGYRHRVPKPLGIEKDARGFVRTLHMNWMRVGGATLSQLEFAEQAAELLSALHEQARVMHLDLRMDNMVITEDGVGFVDFGSACRIGEQIGESPMLDTLFSEMMRTSQIQKMLGKMLERGHVTNRAMAEVHGKVDKTVDSFYLAVQITKPHGNPELKQLIAFDPESETAHALSALTAAVLRPKNPEMAQYKSASDILRGVHRIRRRVERDATRPGGRGRAA